MNKEGFLTELRGRLNGLPDEDIEERISFYGEMIDDRIDEGKSEEEAVNELGGVDKVTDDILKDTPLLNIIKQKVKPKRALKVWEIILLILGFPLWFPLLLIFIILCLLGYLFVWFGVLIFYAVELSFFASSIYGYIVFFINASQGTFTLTYLGLGALGTGLTLLFIFACFGITKATIALSKVTVRNIKRMIVGKGETK